MSSPANNALVRRAIQQAQQQANNDQPWLFPTVDGLNFDKYGAVALPAMGATATILKFTVPNGRNGRITALGIDFTANGGTAFTQNVIPFQLTFSIQTDQAAVGLPDFEAFNFLPGAVSLPVLLGSGLFIKEGQTITVNVTNNTIAAVTTQFLGARVQGYWYPKKREPADVGYQ